MAVRASEGTGMRRRRGMSDAVLFEADLGSLSLRRLDD
jgi:hypothetical protein